MVKGCRKDELPFPQNLYAFSTNIARTRLGTQTDPFSTIRMALASSLGEADSSTQPFAPAMTILRIVAWSMLYPVTMIFRPGQRVFMVVSNSMTFLAG